MSIGLSSPKRIKEVKNFLAGMYYYSYPVEFLDLNVPSADKSSPVGLLPPLTEAKLSYEVTELLTAISIYYA